MMKKIIIFGAGNIGRSLVGYLFSRVGYEVFSKNPKEWLTWLKNHMPS